MTGWLWTFAVVAVAAFALGLSVVVAFALVVAVARPLASAVASASSTSTAFGVIFRALAHFRRQIQLVHRTFNQPLDAAEALLIVRIDQRDALPVAVGPRGSADAVHIVLFIGRHIVIDHQLDVVDVDASADHIGRHEDREFPLSKAEHDLLPFALLRIG